MVKKRVSKSSFVAIVTSVRQRFGRSSAAQVKSTGPRMLKKQKYSSFRMHKKIRPYQAPLPSVRKIVRRSVGILWRNKWLFVSLVLVYVIANIIMVRGIEQALDIPAIKEALADVQNGFGDKALVTASIFGLVLTSSGSSDQKDATLYQSIIIVLTILALIWAVRQIFNGHTIRLREALYQGMYPLIPFLLVAGVVSLQLLPLMVAGWIYQVVIVGGIATLALEKTVWGILILLLVVLSLYMIVSSLFALVIVTLPNMTPMRALRSARALVLHRRWVILRKIIGLSVVLFLGIAVIMLPVIMWAAAVAEWVFLVISSLLVIFPVLYIYILYLELLNEQPQL